jgi:hypothetical protein
MMLLTVGPIPTRKKQETVKMNPKILDPNSIELDVETFREEFDTPCDHHTQQYFQGTDYDCS